MPSTATRNTQSIAQRRPKRGYIFSRFVRRVPSQDEDTAAATTTARHSSNESLPSVAPPSSATRLPPTPVKSKSMPLMIPIEPASDIESPKAAPVGKKKKKKVRFNLDKKAFAETLTRADYTIDEFGQTFYSSQEIQWKYAMAYAMVNRKSFSSNEGTTFFERAENNTSTMETRGLENLMEDSKHKEHTDAVVRIVLLEQASIKRSRMLQKRKQPRGIGRIFRRRRSLSGESLQDTSVIEADERIAALCRKESDARQQEAIDRALDDAKFVDEEVRSENLSGVVINQLSTAAETKKAAMEEPVQETPELENVTGLEETAGVDSDEPTNTEN